MPESRPETTRFQMNSDMTELIIAPRRNQECFQGLTPLSYLDSENLRHDFVFPSPTLLEKKRNNVKDPKQGLEAIQ